MIDLIYRIKTEFKKSVNYRNDEAALTVVKAIVK